MANAPSSFAPKSSSPKPYSKRPSGGPARGDADRRPFKPRTESGSRPGPRRDSRADAPRADRPFQRDSRPHREDDRPIRGPRREYRDRAAIDETPRFEKPARKIPEGADRLDEIKACGINACRAIYKSRKSDLVRAYVTEETMTEFGDMLKWCAANKKAYHVVTSDDLNKISGSTHHEGVCVIAKSKLVSWSSLLEKLSAPKSAPALLLILEDVGNPHNVGAMIRSAAHFGATAIIAPGVDSFKPSPALLRTAEGGAEHVAVVAAPDLTILAAELGKLGFKILATAANGKEALYSDSAMPSRVALIIGNESRGISATARKIAHGILAIPGSGTIDSLNVSAATAIFCSEFWRRHKA